MKKFLPFPIIEATETAPKNLQYWADHWNDQHARCVEIERELGLVCHSAASFWKNRMADYLEYLLPIAKKLYYTTGFPVMDDDQFDDYEERLRGFRPDSPFFEVVGYEIEDDDAMDL